LYVYAILVEGKYGRGRRNYKEDRDLRRAAPDVTV